MFVGDFLKKKNGNESQNSSRPTLIESALHGILWMLPLNASFVLGESDGIKLNYIISSTYVALGGGIWRFHMIARFVLFFYVVVLIVVCSILFVLKYVFS